MGGRAKPSIERDACAWCAAWCRRCSARRREIVVVVANRADEVAWVVADLPVRVVVNEHTRLARDVAAQGLVDLPNPSVRR